MRLEVSGIRKRYGGIVALDGADFTLDRPGIYGLIGPNGAGKTTLFDVITGRVAPDDGRVRLDGEDVTGARPHRLVERGLARTFQECRLLHRETCLDNLLFALQGKAMGGVMSRMLRFDGRARRAAVESAMHMLRLVNLQDYTHSPAAMLSFGQKRLLEIASALVTQPRIVLFDEPASGVNPTLLKVLRDFILARHRETSTLFLIVEHNMEFIFGISEEIVVMHQGAVLERGTPATVKASRKVIDAYLG